MKLTELTKPYMTWKFETINKVKSLFEELNSKLPDIEAKISYSTLNENILVTKDLEDNIQKETYVLKASVNNKRFEYKHVLKEEDDLANIREKAWQNYEAFKYEIEQLKQKEEIK